jgi:hypothetical protein
MAKASKFVYRGRERSVEEVARRSRQSSGSYDGILVGEIPRLKVKEGECTFRILPPTWKDTEKWGLGWEVGIWVHRKVGPDEGTFLCLDKMKGEPCPICEARRDGDEEERDALKMNWRALCWAIDRDNEKAGPQIWEMPPTLFRDINARSIDKKSGDVICIDDPEEGYDILFNREGNDIKTKYTAVEVSRDATPIHESEKTQDRWLEYIQEHSLPDILNFQDSEYIEKVLTGKISKKKDGDEDEEEAAPRRSSRHRSEPEEEEESEAKLPRSRRHVAEAEEEDPTGEVEEDKKPTRRSRAEPEETEEQADPPPRRSRRGAVAEAEEELPEESKTARKGLERLRPGARKAAAEPEEEEEEEAPPPRRRR